MAKKMVKVRATSTAVTTVRANSMRINIVTNTDQKAAKAAEEDGEGNTYEFLVDADVARQLEEKKVAKIVEEDVTVEETGAEPTMGSTSAAEAKKRLAANAEADGEGDTVSGADTRDTTAFATEPLKENTPTNPEPATTDEAPATADAPPTGDETETSKPAAKKAPAKKKS